MAANATRYSSMTKTKKGNALSFFYDPDTGLIVVNLAMKSGFVYEVARLTLDEKKKRNRGG